jgi:hypothetical protein
MPEHSAIFEKMAWTYKEFNADREGSSVRHGREGR